MTEGLSGASCSKSNFDYQNATSNQVGKQGAKQTLGNSRNQQSTSGCCGSKFNAAVSTGRMKSEVDNLKNKIGCTMGNKSKNTLDQLEDIQGSLNGLMESLGEQTGSKGECGDAGQLKALANDLSELAETADIEFSDKEDQVREMLAQVLQLLTKLDGTIHTDMLANLKSQNQNPPKN